MSNKPRKGWDKDENTRRVEKGNGGKGVGKNMGKDARGWSKEGYWRRGLRGKVVRTIMGSCGSWNKVFGRVGGGT